MTSPRLYLFDDGRARRWAPFSLTRPIGELSFGTSRLRIRAEAAFGTACQGHVSRGALVGFDEAGSPPVLPLEDLQVDSGAILLSSRAVLTDVVGSLPAGPARFEIFGSTVGWFIPPGGDLPSDLWLRDPGTAPPVGDAMTVPGLIVDHPWELVERNAAQIIDDLSGRSGGEGALDRVIRVGDGSVFLGDGAHVEAGVVLDTRNGPIHLDAGVRVEGPARLVGPLYVGRSSTILGGTVGHSSIGTGCKIRGEVWESVTGDFVNKAHDGHIGHAMIGSWVNLGAGTTNSDLKNNYGTVSVWTPDGDVDTGSVKVGCFLGDHVKTGIGTLLNTGTVVGAGSNIFGGAMPPVAVPPFSWGGGSQLVTYRIDKFLETTRRAMSRRGVELSPSMADLLSRAWSLTENQRPE